MKLSHALRLTAGDVVALTGGGGKTTAMFQLANELARASSKKMRVLTTTSTRIFAAQIKHSLACVTFNPAQQTITDILPSLEVALDEHRQVLLIGQTEPESGKAFGISPEIVDALAASGHFDIIINEADGSRMRPLKAPAVHEPVIPTTTTLVIPVVGLDVVGQPLADETVHRAALVSQLSGTSLGRPVTTETIATVLSHPQGGLKNVPPRARVIPLLNKASGPTRLAMAREIAIQLLTCQRVDSIAIGAVQDGNQPITEVQGRTAAIILAGGGSTRFGAPKQLAPWGQQTFIERVTDVALASQARPVIAVLGAEVEQSRAALGNRPVELVINEVWAGGQSTSIKAGLAALPPNINSALFLLVDMPAITPATIDALIQQHRQTLAPVVWPEFEGQRGNPVLFDCRLFPELSQIGGDTGGKLVLMAYKDKARPVTVTDEGVVRDFDQPEGLKKAG